MNSEKPTQFSDQNQIETRVNIGLVKLLYDQNGKGLVAIVATATALCGLLWGVVSQTVLIGWWGLAIFVALGRAITLAGYRSVQLTHENWVQWRNIFAAGTLATAATWGAAGVVLFPGENPLGQLFVIAMLVGMVGAAPVYLSAFPWIYVTFACVSLVPFALNLLFLGLPYGILGLAGIPFLGILCASAYGSHRSLTTALRVSLEKELLASDLAAAKEVAERTNRAKSMFLSRVSHELRTPLTAIMGFSELQCIAADLPENHRRNARQIHRASEHLEHLIDDLLDLTRMESDRFSISPEPMDLKIAVRESLVVARQVADPKKMAIALEGNVGSQTWIRGDQTRVKQVLLNLLSNAIKYSPEGSAISISIRETDHDRIRVSVRDQGPGIPKDRWDSIFEPFKRLEASNEKGLGIGLAISKRLVELMGGVIGLESSSADGSCFYFELPVEPSHETEDPEVSDGQGLEFDTPRKILYIEDNVATVELVQRLLSVPNIEFNSAESGERGLEVAVETRPDFVLLDINLPGIDGYQVFKQLKRNEETKGIPVVAVTADALPESVEKLKTAGFQAFLTKPIDTRKLYTIVNRLCDPERFARSQ